MATTAKITGPSTNVPLSITPDQIDTFAKGSNIRRHVIFRACAAYKESSPTEERIPIYVKVTESDDKTSVSAFIQVDEKFSDVLPHLEAAVKKHEEIFLKRKDSKPVVNRPKKGDKICTVVFKTKMEGFMIGKYIGAQGSNIGKIRQSCQDAVKSFSEEEVRVYRPIKDTFMRYVDKFFYIKNDLKTDDSVLIKVTMKYDGNPDIFFRAIKNIMIKSVTDMFKPKKQEWYSGEDEDVEIDVLGGGSGEIITIVNAEDYDEDENFDPGSPHYSPPQ